MSPSPASAAVLAGGLSSRLGFPKALLRLGTGRTLLEETVAKLARLSDDVFVVANDPAFDVPGRRRVPDAVPRKASLGGIYTALSASRHDRVVVVACDMPFLAVGLLRHLLSLEGDAVVPRIDGFPEPLHAVYGRACAEPIRRRLDADQLKIAGFFPDVRVRFVDEPELRRLDPALRSFRNVNTPDLVRQAAEIVEREGPAALG